MPVWATPNLLWLCQFLKIMHGQSQLTSCITSCRSASKVDGTPGPLWSTPAHILLWFRVSLDYLKHKAIPCGCLVCVSRAISAQALQSWQRAASHWRHRWSGGWNVQCLRTLEHKLVATSLPCYTSFCILPYMLSCLKWRKAWRWNLSG